ncbi:recombinase family protein [Mycetocola sp.]|uniref:recombinase family protein n=1 Tax=Mycetocola sp. TaxID=1871042 RepID=UPI0039899946
MPEPAEVKRIQEAARRLLDDRETMSSIIKDWNNKGVQTRTGKHWRQPNLRSILLNRAMLGETKAGVVGWEPILKQRTFDRLHALLTDPSRKITHSPGVKTERYSMGGGLTVCAACGKPLVTNTKNRGDSTVPTLSCLVRVQGPSAKHPRVEREVTRNGTTARVWQESGRVSVAHDRLEEYVFEQAIARMNATARWHQRMSESDPVIEAAIDAFEADRAALRDQRERAGKAFVLGVMSEREAQREVERIDAELEAIERKITDLLGRPAISKLLEHGIDWRAWTPGRRRAFLRLLIDRVEIGAWPDGFSRRVVQQRGEGDDVHAERQRAHAMAAMSKRVQILWLDER